MAFSPSRVTWGCDMALGEGVVPGLIAALAVQPAAAESEAVFLARYPQAAGS